MEQVLQGNETTDEGSEAEEAKSAETEMTTTKTKQPQTQSEEAHLRNWSDHPLYKSQITEIQRVIDIIVQEALLIHMDRRKVQMIKDHEYDLSMLQWERNNASVFQKWVIAERIESLEKKQRNTNRSTELWVIESKENVK